MVPLDYDSDPERWRSWRSATDVHEQVARELSGPVLDAGCGEGRLASVLDGRIAWVGLDSSATQLAACRHRAVVRADMRIIPFGDNWFAEVTHLWCLYELEDPLSAIAEAKRVLRRGGRYYASTAARNNDAELVPEGYPPSSFDAEDAVSMVASIFENVEEDRWDARLYSLQTRDEVRAYCRHHGIAAERAEAVELPVWLTKRGVLIRARKS